MGDRAIAGVGHHQYNVHGVLGIRSQAQLPELEYFRTNELDRAPDLTIEIGAGGSIGHTGEGFQFAEVLGRNGFWIEVLQGPTMRVRSSLLLKLSPHVLYTNVVEPIVRWMLAERGYALVHAACVVSAGKATLITAKTDTGKTTTILKTLANNGHGLQFLSDDMTIIGRDGTVFTYPKPLTISRHTLEAVGTSRLHLLQRLSLQLRSRVHSKSGRRSALALARLPLPMATINAIIQILIPPPKYHVGQLIPGVSIAVKAKATRLAIIELAAQESSAFLEREEGLEVLLRNCEDAYGFPPYQHIAEFLYTNGGKDLQQAERDIIREGTKGCEYILLRRPNRDWWQHLSQTLEQEASLHPNS